ncbi:hypothetical protein KIS4809_2430 [Bacillus sp. ZZV12-4809]|nr:hypothetical protein KIS4809_2430 [Bacillus sp. ZZV12-4809]
MISAPGAGRNVRLRSNQLSRLNWLFEKATNFTKTAYSK